MVGMFSLKPYPSSIMMTLSGASMLLSMIIASFPPYFWIFSDFWVKVQSDRSAIMMVSACMEGIS